jgi:histidinol-phosphate aminotransferase
MSTYPFIKKSIHEISEYVVGGKPLQPGLIKLNQNENPYDIPDELKRTLLDEFRVQPWNRYPETFPADLLKALSVAVNHPVEGIIAGNGSNELMYTIFMATVTRGTKVLIPSPTFFLYEKAVRVFDGEVVAVRMNDDLSFSTEKIVEAIQKEKPSVVVLVSPNSPTGQSLAIADVKRILHTSDALVLVDEAYVEFSDRGSVQPLLAENSNLILLRTFSKAFSMAGLRVGYLLAAPRLCAEILKPKIPFAVHAFSALAAITLMNNRDVVTARIRAIKEQKTWLQRQLEMIEGIEVFSSDTNFLIFKTRHAADVLFRRLLDENVLIRDVSSYPMLDRTLRVNAGLKEENEKFISVLKNILLEMA